MALGLPSTGLHFSPPLRYHVGSHYVQAGLAQVFGFNVWTSWALLFDFKSVVIVTAFLWLGIRVAEKFGLGPWLAFATLAIPGLSWNWFVVGNFPYWLPTLLLILTAPWVGKKLNQAVYGPRDLLLLTFLFVALALGKIEIGLAWGAFVGGWMAGTRPWAKRVLATGLVWVVLLFLFGRQFNSDSRQTRAGTTSELVDTNLYLLACLVTVLVAGVGLGRSLSVRGMSIGAVFLLVALSATGLMANLSVIDIESLVFSAILVAILVLIGWIVSTTRPAAELRVAVLRRFFLLAVTAQILLSAVPPSPQVPSLLNDKTNIAQLADALSEVNRAPFESINEFRDRDSQLSIWRQLSAPLSGRDFDPADVTSRVDRVFQSALEELDQREAQPGEAVLFISAEERHRLANYWNTEELWTLGFFVKAISGISLIHGVDGNPHGGWGLDDYGDDSQVRTNGQFVVIDACRKAQHIVSLSFSRQTTEFLCKFEAPGRP